MNTVLEQFKSFIGRHAKDSSPSPYGRWLNGKLLLAEAGKLEVEFLIREDMSNPAGIIHGGVLAGMMDEVIGMTIFTLGNQAFYAAANLNSDFLRPGKIGESLIVKSEVIREGKTMVHAECKIYNEAGKLIAKASSNMIKTTFLG